MAQGGALFMRFKHAICLMFPWATVLATPDPAMIHFVNNTNNPITEELLMYSCGIDQEPTRLIILRPGRTDINFSLRSKAMQHNCNLGLAISRLNERRAAIVQLSVDTDQGVVTRINPGVSVSYDIPDLRIRVHRLETNDIELVLGS